MSLIALTLAAGRGTRMKSDLPKVIHPILNKPMIRYVVDAVSLAKPSKIYIVARYKKDLISSCLENCNLKVEYVFQERQLGTGHAVFIAQSKLKSHKGNILIVNGDSPAITGGELRKLVRKHSKSGAAISLITAEVENPHGYGRMVRDSNNKVQGIIEEKDATAKEKKIREINSGIYCVRSDFLWDALRNLRSDNEQGEYYLPGIVGYAVSKGLKVIVNNISDPNEILGVNNRLELSVMENYLRSKIVKKLCVSGVTIIDPESTFIAPDVKIGSDTVIYPGTYIYGDTKTGSSCTIGPNVYMENCNVGKNVKIRFSSYLDRSKIGNDTIVGPFAHLRPGAHVGDGSKIGNFVEIKKSKIGGGSKIPHLSYVGDAIVGKKVNIGAGTITCNYDGVNKHQTIIEDNVFIGSDSMLVAPIKVGKGAVTAAGSTITKDVDRDSLAIERSQQKIIKGWNKRNKR